MLQENEYRIITKDNFERFIELATKYPEELEMCQCDTAGHVYGGVFETCHWVCIDCGKDLGEDDPD